MNQKANEAIAKATGWVAVGIYAAMGLCSILLPQQAATIILYSLAIILALMGGYGILSYIKSAPKENERQSYALTIGLSLLTAGIVIAAIPQQLVKLIVFLVGAALIVGGYAKLQLTFDAKRRNEKLWWTYLVAAIISLVLGVVIITTRAATLFFGISLAVEAALDAASLIIKRISAKKLARQKTEKEAAAASPVAPAAQKPAEADLHAVPTVEQPAAPAPEEATVIDK